MNFIITFHATILGAKRHINDISSHAGLTFMMNDALEQVTCSEEKTVKFFFLSCLRSK